MKILKIKKLDGSSATSKSIAGRLNSNLDLFPAEEKKDISKLADLLKKDEELAKDFFNTRLKKTTRFILKEKTPFIYELLRTL